MTDHELSADYFNRTMLSSAGQSKGRFRFGTEIRVPGSLRSRTSATANAPWRRFDGGSHKKSRIVPDAALTGFADPLYG